MIGLALLAGVIRRAGKVQFNAEYVQKAIFQEDFQMLGFLGVAAMVGSVNFVVFMPFIIQAWIVMGQIALDPSGVTAPFTALVSALKSILLKGPSHQQRIELKADIEVMTGFYLVFAWFFGMSSMVAILFYWQVMRLHYMLSYQCQHAFSRFDQKLQAAVFSRSFCPAIVKKAYDSIKSVMVSMGTMPDPTQQQAQS